MNSDFEKAKLKQERLTAASAAAGEVLRAFPRNAMGLVSDAVRTSPAYQAARVESQRAFDALRAFNGVFTKTFAKELRDERARRFAGHQSSTPKRPRAAAARRGRGRDAGRYLVVLKSVNNPDYDHDARAVPARRVPVGSLRDAQRACLSFIEQHGLGSGNWQGGAVIEAATGQVVARISYNGRIWDPIDPHTELDPEERR